jgi:hypothetical protein
MPQCAPQAPAQAIACSKELGWTVMAAVALFALSNAVAAMDANPESSPPSTIGAPTLPPIAAPKWTELMENERQVLQPLALVWDDMSTTRRRKWRSIVKNYAQLSPTDQAKIRERMGEWALLSTKERQLARLNFAQSKNVNSQELASHWETYQSLSEADRKALSDRTPPVPAGAAIAPKPIPKEKLATIAVTRHSTDAQRATASAVQPIDRKTLLPLRPATPAKPASPGGA